MNTVDSTPTNPHDLTFTADEFMGNLAAVEGGWPALSALQGLIKQMVDLQLRQVNFSDFVNSHIPQEGASPLLATLLLAVDANGILDATGSGGVSEAATEAIYESIATYAMENIGSIGSDGIPRTNLHEAAVAFVESLPTVELSTIPREDMRCPHCWADFDEEVEGYNNEPKRVPCCGSRFGKDCLIQSIEGTGMRCPKCRRDWPMRSSPRRN
jgi:hypothetical protein